MKTLLLLAVVLLAGCSQSPVPVLDLKISEGDQEDYNRSLVAIAMRQTPAERTEFEKALQELKFQAMTGEGSSAGPKTDAIVQEKIAGLMVREVIGLGHTLKLDRKMTEEKQLLRSIAKNRRLRTKPGDEASATFLASTHANQDLQLKVLRDEIAALKQRLNELNPRRSPSAEPVVPMNELEEKPEMERKSPTRA